ncbi:hypothetical protein C6P46_002887 [Rhodotorula mucilaginosa]|uniref:DNA-directed DNA polymerase family B exonuclease domain-containing protein n=1 Tax=Rhodotorula mucilaginosa TaxID=5537 RepID=A0A9P6VS84_RHOMI|nr:hypothetical protein C6P46_002887 [Rhodotorula mucilaginosa]
MLSPLCRSATLHGTRLPPGLRLLQAVSDGGAAAWFKSATGIKELYHVQMPTGGVNWTASTQPSSSLQHEATLRPGHSPRPVASKGTLPPCARIVALNLETTTIGKPNPTPSVHSEQTPSVQPRLTPPNLDPDEQANLQPTKQAVCVASLLDYQAGTKDSVPIMETISSKRIVKDGVPVTEMIPSKRIIIAVRSIEPIIGCQTISVASELELLQVLDLCLRTADPDILVGHNILQFNIPVLRASVRRLGANFTMALGRADSDQFVPGRQVANTVCMARANRGSDLIRWNDRCRLADLATNLLGDAKVDMPDDWLQHRWTTMPSHLKQDTLLYCLHMSRRPHTQTGFCREVRSTGEPSHGKAQRVSRRFRRKQLVAH